MDAGQLLLILCRQLKSFDEDKINSFILKTILTENTPLNIKSLYILYIGASSSHPTILYFRICGWVNTQINISRPIRFNREEKWLSFQDGACHNTNYVTLSILKTPYRDNQCFIRWPTTSVPVWGNIINMHSYYSLFFSTKDLKPFMETFFSELNKYMEDGFDVYNNLSELIAWKHYVLSTCDPDIKNISSE
jgi:hypothetical protein